MVSDTSKGAVSAAGEHAHEWQPNGQVVREHAEARGPVSHLYDTLYTKVFSVMICECGATKRVHVANENVRERSADPRKGPSC